MFHPKILMDLLARVSHSGFKTVVLNNRMLMQCYDVSNDSDQGFHYALHIPDNPIYEDEFFDETLLLVTNDIRTTYRDGHKEIEEMRKERKMKPRAVVEECYYIKKSNGRSLKFLFYLDGTLRFKKVVDLPWPFDETDQRADIVANAYTNCLKRLRIGGTCMTVDGLELRIPDRVYYGNGIYRLKLEFGKKEFVLPITRTLLLGIKKFDSLKITVQETNLDDIYVFAISILTNGICETLWGYAFAY